MLQLIIMVIMPLMSVEAQERPAESVPVAKPLSVCDLLTDPSKYNGHVVAVRGLVTGTDEGAWLKADVACKKPLTTYGFTWPQYLWLEIADTPLIVGRVGFQTDAAALRKIDIETRRMSLDYEKDRIRLTYVGVFETRDYKPSDIGINRAYGFGHMNAAPGQIVIRTVKDLEVERNYKHE
jgi:hypothetical protein